MLFRSAEYENRPIEAWFVRLDTDDDNRLTVAEYGVGDPDLVKNGRCEAIVRTLDTDADGTLQLKEFSTRTEDFNFQMRDHDGDEHLSLAEYLGSIDTTKVSVETDIFQILDGNHDEVLTLAEYKSQPREAVYRRMDSNGDGTLDLSEFHMADMPRASVNYATKVFALLDMDANGGISVDELHARPLGAWFLRSDANEDGILSLEELARVNPQMKAEHCHSVFAALDSDDDGNVVQVEFENRSPEVNFRQIDVDTNGLMTLEEFMAAFHTPDQIKWAQETFSKKDANGDSQLTLEEYSQSSI